MILLLVLGALVISYGSSLRAYLRQQDQIHQLDAQIAASKAASSANEQERKRLDDPSYIKTLARLRFGWVMPGQTPYVVLGTDGKPLDSKAQLDAHPPTTQESPDAWWDRVTGSLLTADNPPVTTTVKKPTPEKKIP